MKHRVVSRSEFTAAVRQAGRVTPPRPQDLHAPLHTEAFSEAAIILAAAFVFVTLVHYALLEAGIL